ncbi:hypothetical protein FRB90_002208 [Tulasnella sp. 427]|nr:hypothetical protein FRB90_002208 [Tulasnella sp. 427]
MTSASDLLAELDLRIGEMQQAYPGLASLAGVLEEFRQVAKSYPYDEHARLKTPAQCDEEIYLLDALRERIQLHLKHARSKRNTFAAINALPSKVLATIFFHVMSRSAVPVCYDVPFILRSVCHRWRWVTDATPYLWLAVHQDPKRPFVRAQQALAKSRRLPLDVSFSALAYEQKNLRFLDAILPHAHRWRRLSLVNLGEPEALQTLGGVEMPQLQELAISCKFDEQAEDSVEEEEEEEGHSEPLHDLLCGEPSPRLRNVSLRGIGLTFDLSVLSHLFELDLARIRGGLLIDHMLDILIACPELRTLSLTRIILDERLFEDHRSRSDLPIHLPALEFLQLTKLDWSDIVSILGAIRAPNCTDARIVASSEAPGDPRSQIFNEGLSHFFDLMRRRRDPQGREVCSNICFNGEDGETTWQWFGPWEMTWLFEGTAHFKYLFQWFTVPIREARGGSAERLNVEIPNASPNAAFVTLRTLMDMEEVHSVMLGVDIDPLNGLRTLLGRHEGNGRWFFPGLTTIWLIGDIGNDDLEQVVQLVRERQEAAVRVSAEVSQKPKRIRHLCMGHRDSDVANLRLANLRSHYWPGGLDRLRHLIGLRGSFYWYGEKISMAGHAESDDEDESDEETTDVDA